MSRGERYALIVALGVAALISGPWFYTQLLVWKAEGHDHMLTVANIVLTVLLWSVLAFGAYKAFKDSGRAAKLKSALTTARDEHEIQLAHQETLRKQAEQRADLEKRKAAQSAKESEGFKDQTRLAKEEIRSLQYLVDKQAASLNEDSANTAILRNTYQDTLERLSAIRRHLGDDTLEKTPDGLRRCAATLAGNLFAVLVELGEDPNPQQKYDPSGGIAGDDCPPDQRVIERITSMEFYTRLKEAMLYARDIGIWTSNARWELDSLVRDTPQNAKDIRHKIECLLVLEELIIQRFPNPPELFGDKA